MPRAPLVQRPWYTQSRYARLHQLTATDDATSPAHRWTRRLRSWMRVRLTCQLGLSASIILVVIQVVIPLLPGGEHAAAAASGASAVAGSLSGLFTIGFLASSFLLGRIEVELLAFHLHRQHSP